MLRRAGALALLVLAAVACGGESFDGTWRLVSFEVAGEPFPAAGPLFLEIEGDGFGADTTCNSVSGEFGGELAMTAMACVDPVQTEGERHMVAAFGAQPVEVDGRLLFVEGDVRLIYEPFAEPATLDLVSILGDERRSVDQAVLPPASVTGSVPPEYEALIPVPSPVPSIDLFLGALDGRPCVVYGTETSTGSACTGPRELSFRTRTVNVPQDDPSYLRVALIPDDFEAAAASSGLGTYDTNLLIVADTIAAGTPVLTNSAGNELTVVIGEPSAEPPTVPTTEP